MKTLANIWQRGYLLVAIVSCVILQQVSAQNLNNQGQILNTDGLIRVQGQTTWAADTIQGTMEMYGQNQRVPIKKYNNLILSGSGLDYASGGHFSIFGNLFVAPTVTFDLQNGSTITLGDTLFEQGYVRGRIQKIDTLAAGTSVSNFGQIGASISWQDRPLGATVITRSADTISRGNGQQSIRRYYDIIPTTKTRLNATFVFKYSTTELGTYNPNTLELWRSTNNGFTWRRQGGVVDTAQRTITKSGIVQFSRWTASDASHLLGLPQYEWRPDTLLYFSGDTQRVNRRTTLSSPFVVRLRDYFGNWLERDTVVFAIAGNAKDATLSVSRTITDSSGYASTYLTIGDSIGSFVVTASNPSIPTKVVRFTATAVPSKFVAAVQSTSGGNQPAAQILSTMSPFVLTAVDSLGFPVPNDTVQFSIVSAPANASGQSLSTTRVLTSDNGIASSTLRLGNKVGTYSIRAVSRSLPANQIIFNVQAIDGNPDSMIVLSGDDQIRQVADTLRNPFVLIVADTGANPVQGVQVNYTLTTPTNAQNYHLSADSVFTDSLGQASVNLILGDTPGLYTVTATASGLAPVTFTARGFLLTGDANGDESFNVADITTLIDHITGKKRLAGMDSLRADLNHDGVINVKDIDSIRNFILNERIISDSGAAVPSPKVAIQTRSNIDSSQMNISLAKDGLTQKTQVAEGTLELTPNGLRFNLANDIPVTGIQIYFQYRSTNYVQMEAPELVYSRMRHMEVYVHSIGRKVRIIAYNLNNSPIDTGNGTLFRLPLFLESTALIDTEQVVLSTLENKAVVFQAVTSIAQPGDVYPTHYAVHQNYPNPFNGSTVISFDIPDLQGRFAKILVQVFDLLGREIKTLYVGEMEAGFAKQVVWDGTNTRGTQVASGIYFYRVFSRDYIGVKKMIYLK